MHRSVLKAVARQASSVSTTLLGLLALTFFMGRMLPIDPVLSIVGDQADQSTYDMVHRQLGLDKPLYVQFFLYIRSMLSGDFGNALFTGHRVADDLMKVFPATVELATFAIIIGVVVGTYSSIFIASPIVLWWTRARGGSATALRREITQKATTANPAAS